MKDIFRQSAFDGFKNPLRVGTLPRGKRDRCINVPNLRGGA
jgi:hypothetical protein